MELPRKSKELTKQDGAVMEKLGVHGEAATLSFDTVTGTLIAVSSHSPTWPSF